MLKFFSFLLLFVGYTTFANQEVPYSWEAEVVGIEEGEVEIHFRCILKEGWHIYAAKNNPNYGIPTSIKILPNSLFAEVVGSEEPSVIAKYDALFDDSLYYHKGTPIYRKIIGIKSSGDLTITANVTTQACNETGFCTRPESQELIIEVGEVEGKSKSSFWIFWAGLLAGFVALLTPCVFPLIPLTVTFFTKQSEKRSSGVFRAFVYGVSIVLIYVALGFSVTVLLGPEALNKMASSPIFNLFFFALLIAFSLSFLGLFEITIPSALVNKIDAKADSGGWVGIFFMAFALALVSFSCTGPLIGTLLVEAAVNAGVKGPLLGMLGFSTALALPFTLFAVFPSWLNKLPKSGGWLNSVKVVLGLLEIALAVKFLSNADLVYQANLLPRELFIGIWIAVFLVIAFYLFGWIRFKLDVKLKRIGAIRMILGLASLSFVAYLFPGLFGAELKLLSGVLPPTFYTFNWDSNQEHNCPNDLDCFHDYEKAKSMAIKEDKPLLLDFTGWTCVNCRYMEQNIWSVPAIDSLIRNEFILASLYVDDRTQLPQDEQTKGDGIKKDLLTYGDKWADFEVTKFGEITQPLYVVVDGKGNQVGEKATYTVSAEKYLHFLQNAIQQYKAGKKIEKD